ncbi:hypothetical protein V6N12_043011 [Hibiscus sabdariffa]|uniref:Uncharacterized protein n=1 Tax=Hibiscus sabdariffa TaxID=183260 RepID=A0ABR2DI03_9ROSI
MEGIQSEHALDTTVQPTVNSGVEPAIEPVVDKATTTLVAPTCEEGIQSRHAANTAIQPLVNSGGEPIAETEFDEATTTPGLSSNVADDFSLHNKSEFHTSSINSLDGLSD